MEVVKNKIEVQVPLPKKDLSKWEETQQIITVSTELDTIKNSFIFKTTLPKYIFDVVGDTDEKYELNPPKPEKTYMTRKKKFSQRLSDVTLKGLLEQLNDICIDAISVRDTEMAQDEKYIAIKFKHSHMQQKDNYNFADMGKATSSSFQFFTVYKILNKSNFGRRDYRTDVRIGGLNYAKSRKWNYYQHGVVGQFQLIKWTKEREEFLQKIQKNFIDLNENLNEYLGNIDDDKINLLIANYSNIRLLNPAPKKKEK